MTRTTLLLLALPTSGCIVYDGTRSPHVVNHAPYVYSAEAGCYWDQPLRDYVWWFEADVRDPDGSRDVYYVYADVYDRHNGAWMDTFELFHEGGSIWYSDWLQASTWLDCYYPNYVVDFVAYDSHDAIGSLSVRPYTE